MKTKRRIRVTFEGYVPIETVERIARLDSAKMKSKAQVLEGTRKVLRLIERDVVGTVLEIGVITEESK